MQIHRVASGHGNHAVVNINGAAIGDILTNKRNGLRLDHAFVGDLAGQVCEIVLTANKIVVAHGAGGGVETTHVDQRAVANADALWIDQVHDAVAEQASIDAAEFGASDTIEHARCRAWLNELHDLAGFN